MNIFTDPHFWIGVGLGALAVVFVFFLYCVYWIVELGKRDDDGLGEDETGDDVLPPILTTPFIEDNERTRKGLSALEKPPLGRRSTDRRTGILSNDDVR